MSMAKLGLSRRRFLRGSAGIAGLAVVGPSALVAACSTPTPSGSASAAPPAGSAGPGASPAASAAVKGGTVTYGGEAINNLNPVLQGGNGEENRHASLMFQGLLGLKPDGSMAPLLASELPEVSADNTTYTFKLRPNMTWSDGKPLTSEDVAYTYRLHYHADYEGVKSNLRSALKALIADIQTPDPTTVVIKLQHPQASFLLNYAWRLVVPQHILGTLTPDQFNENAFGVDPSVSSGPFKLGAYVAGSHLELVRNDLFYGGAPNLDKWVCKFASHDSTIGELKVGTTDVYRATAFARFEEIRGIDGVTLDTFESATGIACYFNLDPAHAASAIFSSKAVRQALMYATDRPGTVKAAIFDNGVVPESAAGIYPSFNWANDPNPKAKWSFDPAKAASLLEGDGWIAGADGIRAKNGAPLKFDLTTSQESAEWGSAAAILQQNWRDVGADVGIRKVPYGELANQVLFDRDFDVCFFGAPSRFSPDPDVTGLFHSRNAVPGGSNWTAYKNAEVDTILDEAAKTTNQADRVPLYISLQEILNDELPVFTFQFWREGWVHNNRVMNCVPPEWLGAYAANQWLFGKDVWVTDGK